MSAEPYSELLLSLAKRACPPMRYQDCPEVEACVADVSVGAECWISWLMAYAQSRSDGQDWKNPDMEAKGQRL